MGPGDPSGTSMAPGAQNGLKIDGIGQKSSPSFVEAAEAASDDEAAWLLEPIDVTTSSRAPGCDLQRPRAHAHT